MAKDAEEEKAVPNFTDALKNLQDMQAILGQKTLGGMLAAHEQMAERHRQISMVESLEAIAAGQKEQGAHAKAAAVAASTAASNAIAAERRRVAALPRCPACQTPIEHGEPEICPQCMRPMFWYFKCEGWSRHQPVLVRVALSPKDAVTFCQHIEADSVIRSLAHEINLLREAASVSVYGFDLQAVDISGMEAKRYAYVSDPEKPGSIDITPDINARAFHLGRVAQLFCMLNAKADLLKAHVKRIEDFASRVAAAMRETKWMLGEEIESTLAAAERSRPVLDKPFGDWLASPFGRVDFAYALKLMTTDFANPYRTPGAIPEKLTAFLVDESIDLGPPPGKSWFGGRQDPSQEITEHMLVGRLVSGCIRMGFEMGGRLWRADGTCFLIGDIDRVEQNGVARSAVSNATTPGSETKVSVVVSRGKSLGGETVAAGIPRSYEVREDDCLVWQLTLHGKGELSQRAVPQDDEIQAALKIARGVPGKLLEQKDTATEGDVLRVLLDGLCCIAAADGRLKDQEIKVITEALRQAGCKTSDESIKTGVVVSSQKIHRNGVESFAKHFVDAMKPHRAGALCKLLLDLQRTVAQSDGVVAAKEHKILAMFQQELAN